MSSGRASRCRLPPGGSLFEGEAMPSSSDITLAIGDGARRMTYAELVAIRGRSAVSAERLVRRPRWPHQVGNYGVVGVLVSLTEVRNRRQPAAANRSPDNSSNVRISGLSSRVPDPQDNAPLEPTITAQTMRAVLLASATADRSKLLTIYRLSLS
jgi:hypothetical protein